MTLIMAIHQTAAVVIAVSAATVGAILLIARRRLRYDPIGREVFALFGVALVLGAASRLSGMFAITCEPAAWDTALDVLTAIAWAATAGVIARFKLALIRSDR